MAVKARHLAAGMTLLAVLFVIYIYGRVIAVQLPSSQAADLAIVIDGLNPDSTAGLRVDVVADVPVHLWGCEKTTPVQVVISGTPDFWARYEEELQGEIHIGIGLRTSYRNARLLDWSGYDLPEALLNLGPDDRIPNPNRSGSVEVSDGEDSSTGARWFTVTVTDWQEHRTPLVLEFDASWTSSRGTGSCYFVLPELTALDTSAVSDARAAASGAESVFDESGGGGAFSGRERVPGAVTFGRVIVRTEGHIVDGESRPGPRLVDGNPWASDLGSIGEEAGVWTCIPPSSRDDFPNAGLPSPSGDESAPPLDTAAAVGCGGLAIIEARNAGTVRDLALLVVGGLFGFIFQRLISESKHTARWVWSILQNRSARHTGTEGD
jgi:hypothetical protein